MTRLAVIYCTSQLAVLVLITPPFTAAADVASASISAEISVGSHLTDRGETLAAGYTEAGIGVDAPLGDGRAYIALGRITPIAERASEYDDEVAYSLGYTLEQERWSIDLSVNRLTYPEAEGGEATEFIADVSIDYLFEPQATVFYDSESGDYGLEGRIGHTIDVGSWSLSAIALAGLVAAVDGSDRSYLGLETSASISIRQNVDLESFAFVGAADELSFVQSFTADGQPRQSDQASGAGLRLSWVID